MATYYDEGTPEYAAAMAAREKRHNQAPAPAAVEQATESEAQREARITALEARVADYNSRKTASASQASGGGGIAYKLGRAVGWAKHPIGYGQHVAASYNEGFSEGRAGPRQAPAPQRTARPAPQRQAPPQRQVQRQVPRAPVQQRRQATASYNDFFDPFASGSNGLPDPFAGGFMNGGFDGFPDPFTIPKQKPRARTGRKKLRRKHRKSR